MFGLDTYLVQPEENKKSLKSCSSFLVAGNIVMKKPSFPAICFIVSVTQSLLSAIYMKSFRPNNLQSVFHVSTCVVSSVIFPSHASYRIGMAPSAVTVSIHNICFRSGL